MHFIPLSLALHRSRPSTRLKSRFLLWFYSPRLLRQTVAVRGGCSFAFFCFHFCFLFSPSQQGTTAAALCSLSNVQEGSVSIHNASYYFVATYNAVDETHSS